MSSTYTDPISKLLSLSPRRVPFAILRSSVLILLLFTVLTGLLYPLLVTGVAQVLFPAQANGSLLRDAQGQVRGSRLLSQDFTGSNFFQARPSAVGYTAAASGGSNLAITNQKQDQAIAQREKDWTSQFGTGKAPADMRYASGSGLDPEISLESALAQCERISHSRGLDKTADQALRNLINSLGQNVLPGEPQRVNVMDLNLSLLNESAYNSKK